MTEKCYNLYHGVCDEMDIKSSAYCVSPNCWGTLESCCPGHVTKKLPEECTGKCVTVIVDPNKPDDTCSCKRLGDGEGGACEDPDKCQMVCERWATTLDHCNNSNNGGRNNSNNRGRNNSNNGNVTDQSNTDGSGISAGAGIAIGIVSIFALVGFIALIIGGSGSKRRSTRGNRRSR